MTSVTEADLCPAVFDGYLCWPKIPAGSTVELPCPKGVAGLDENSEFKSFICKELQFVGIASFKHNDNDVTHAFILLSCICKH